MAGEHPNFRQGLERTEAAWRDLLAALDGIPPERLDEPGVTGDWSVKDLMAHTAFWDEEGATKLRRLGAGLPLGRVDFQLLNDSEAAARADWSPAQARDALDKAHAMLVLTMTSHPEIDPAEIAMDTWDHYADHANEIRGWRGR